MQPAGIELQHGGFGDPGIGLQPRPRLASIQEQERRAPADAGRGEDVVTGEAALASKRDRGDAKTGRVRQRIAEIAELASDLRHMPATHGAVGRRSPAPASARQRCRRRAERCHCSSRQSQRRRRRVQPPRPGLKARRMRPRARRSPGTAPAAGRMAAPSVTGSAMRPRPSIAPAHRKRDPRVPRARAPARFRSFPVGC